MEERVSSRAAETVPIEHEASERVVRTLVVALPLAALAWAGWLARGTLHWQDLLVLAITYTLSGLGITVGYHRLFTHRSFKTTRTLRALFAVLGSMAVEGPVIEWAATHRKHHRFSDHPGDPTAPTSTARPDGAGRYADWAMRTSAGCSAARTWPTPPAMPRICSPTATCASSAAPSRSGWWSGWPSLRPRRGAHRLGRRRAHRTVVGRSGARVPCASCDLQHQLALSRLRRPTVRDRRRITQPRLAGAGHIGRGLAQQPPRLPHLRPSRTGPPGARPRCLAHQRWSAATWPGTWSGSPPSASRQTRRRAGRVTIAPARAVTLSNALVIDEQRLPRQVGASKGETWAQWGLLRALAEPDPLAAPREARE